jgi:hypothetical protein
LKTRNFSLFEVCIAEQLIKTLTISGNNRVFFCVATSASNQGSSRAAPISPKPSSYALQHPCVPLCTLPDMGIYYPQRLLCGNVHCVHYYDYKWAMAVQLFLYIILRICDCSKAPSPGMAPVHLLVLIHGMWGNPSNLAELARIARETHSSPSSDGTRLHLLVAQTIQKELTYDGVDWCGEQVVEEVCSRIDDPIIISSTKWQLTIFRSQGRGNCQRTSQ